MKTLQKIVLATLILSSIGFGGQLVHAADTYTANLTVGSTGAQVAALQTWLIAHSFDIQAISSGVSQKGYFGSQTQAALIAYQKSIGLPPFGFFGPLTRQYLNTTGPLTVVYPNGGESWQKGTYQNIIWTSAPSATASLEINLIPYQAPCVTKICPMTAMLVRAPILIASGIDIQKHSYAWDVGSYGSGVSYIPEMPVPSIPDGQYSIRICETSTSVCDISDAPFTISSTVVDAQMPVITGVDAPSLLTTGQAGTWTIRASDPQSSQLSYSVNWGDRIYAVSDCDPIPGVDANATPVPCPKSVSSPNQTAFVNSSSFTHTYYLPGTYTVTFTVQNTAGKQVQTATTLQVVAPSASAIKVTSPNGGEKWTIGSVHQITWVNGNINPTGTVDLYLDGVIPPCISGYVCDPIPPYVLDKNIPANAVYNWIAGTDVNNAYIPAYNYFVEVCQAGTGICDKSDTSFSLVGTSTSVQ